MGHLLGTEDRPSAADRRQIRGRWRVQEFRRVNERWYVFGKVLREYFPLEYPNLPAHFVAQSSESFFRNYGPLGWYLTSEVEQNLDWKHATKQEKYDLIDEIGPVAFSAEPLDWIEAHRRNVAWCLNAGAVFTMTLESKRDRDKTAALYDEIRLAIPDFVGMGNTVTKSWTLFGPKFAPRERLGRVLAVALGGNLGGTRRWVQYENDALHTSWGGLSLIDNIYSLVADAITSERLRICEHCQRPFVQTDKRQRFCPPVRIGARSTCMNTALVRRKRAAAARRARTAVAKEKP